MDAETLSGAATGQEAADTADMAASPSLTALMQEAAESGPTQRTSPLLQPPLSAGSAAAKGGRRTRGDAHLASAGRRVLSERHAVSSWRVHPSDSDLIFRMRGGELVGVPRWRRRSAAPTAQAADSSISLSTSPTSAALPAASRLPAPPARESQGAAAQPKAAQADPSLVVI